MNQPRPIIWVVDDDETILILAREALAEHGFDVDVFATATAASEALTSNLPDFIFLDVLLPELNGYEFCAHLRSRAGGEDVPVLMMTFLDDAEAINMAYEAGATGFVTKPINWNIEIQRLRYMLRAAETAGQLRQNEEETRQAKEAWENTFNAIHDTVVVVDRNLRILKANQTTCELLQLTLPQIIGQRTCELFEGIDEPSANCPVARALQTGLPAAAEINYLHPPGTRLVSASPIRGRDGAVNQVVMVARDLSEQKRLEAQLRQVQKMEAVGTLAGGVAHEFNNLLQAVIGSAELLKMSKPSDHEDLVDIRAILDAAKRGGALTRQMLAFSRKGALWTEKIPLNLNDVIDTVQAMVTQSLARNGQVNVQLASDLRKIKGDPEQLQQIVVNMAMNSTQAMTQGGHLTITTANMRTREDGPIEFVALTIADTGEGMSKETQDRMYEPFFTTRGVGKGTGLGLSAVFGIVKEHLADIHCESQPGVGTTFQIRFPVIPEPKSTPSIFLPVATVKRPTIMVVDDEEPLRKALQRMLGRLGFDVLSAPDGPHALRTFTQHTQRPNLVILDLGLPIMSGWECLEKLRIIDASARVLVATGYGGDDLESRARSLGAAGILMKPYDFTALGDKVRSILGAPAPAN